MYKWKSHPPCLTANSRYNTPCSGAEEQLSSGIIPDLHCGGWNEKLSQQSICNWRSNMIFFFLGSSCSSSASCVSSSAWTATHSWQSVRSCWVLYNRTVKHSPTPEELETQEDTSLLMTVWKKYFWLLGQPLSCCLRVVWKRSCLKRILMYPDICGCFFHTKAARIKPKADFGKIGLADGVGGDHLGQKKCCLGVKAVLSVLLPHQLMLEHGPQWVGNHAGHRLPPPQLSAMKMDMAGDVLLLGKDEEIEESRTWKTISWSFKRGKFWSEMTSKMLFGTLFWKFILSKRIDLYQKYRTKRNRN